MSRIITFSTKFPSYHPKKGQPTNFVEKILKGLIDIQFNEPQNIADYIYDTGKRMGYDYADTFLQAVNSSTPKYHTIRSGNRWKVGDTFSPRIWSGKPYRSKMITIAPDITVEKVFSFEIDNGCIFAGKQGLVFEVMNPDNIQILFEHDIWFQIAKNDGLKEQELLDWFKFPKNFSGQIICWDKEINY